MGHVLIGVPPKDVLAAILKKNSDGEAQVDLKRKEIQTLLNDEVLLLNHVQSRIQSGEFDIKALVSQRAQELKRDAELPPTK